jgi:hypothetical protein
MKEALSEGMLGHLIVKNFFIFTPAVGGCIIAHFAGLKYALYTQKRGRLGPAIVASVESAVLLIAALIIAEIAK